MNKQALKTIRMYNHFLNIGKLFKLEVVEAGNLYFKLRGLEKKLNRLFMVAFDRELREREQKLVERIQKQVEKLTNNVEGLFFNHDARGYSIKIDDEVVKKWRESDKVNLYTDFGGYGILAPEY